jgi:hypothetical protein
MKTLGRTVRAGRLWGTGLALVLCAAVSARGQVLDQVPDDALAVFKINHLQDTSKKLAELMQALGVTDFAPAMADPLKATEDQAGISAGLDTAGDAAAVLLNGPWPDDKKMDDGKETPPPLVILIPVSDYKAFLTNATVVKTEGDITTVHFKKDTNNEDTYVTQWGSYAAISPLKQSVSKKPAGLKVASLAAKQLSDKDAILYVNWPVLKTVLLPKLQESRAKILAEVDKNLNKADKDLDVPAVGSKSPVIKAVVNRIMDLAQGFMEQSQATTIGYSFSKSGVNATMMMEFTPDSYMGKLAQQIKGTDQPLLTGLAADKYLVYGGVVQDPKVTTQVLDDLVGPISKELANMGEKGKAIQSSIDRAKNVMGLIEGYSAGMVAPNPNQMGQTGVLQIVAVDKTTDAEKLQAAAVEQYKAQDDMLKALSGPKAPQMKTTVTENAKTVDGVKFNQVQMQVNLQGNTPEEMQADQMMKIMYGPNGINANVGVVDPKTLLMVVGGNDQLLSSAVTAAKANTDAISATEAMKTVDSQLPKTRSAAAYVPLDVIVSTAVGYAGKFGFPVPVQLPPNLPPIGITAGTEGSAIRLDEFIPTPLVQSLIQAGMQTYLQLQGGHGNGAGGGGL